MLHLARADVAYGPATITRLLHSRGLAAHTPAGLAPMPLFGFAQKVGPRPYLWEGLGNLSSLTGVKGGVPLLANDMGGWVGETTLAAKRHGT